LSTDFAVLLHATELTLITIVRLFLRYYKCLTSTHRNNSCKFREFW